MVVDIHSHEVSFQLTMRMWYQSNVFIDHLSLVKQGDYSLVASICSYVHPSISQLVSLSICLGTQRLRSRSKVEVCFFVCHSQCDIMPL